MGDLARPWQTVSGALNHVGASALDNHCIHVFAGLYAETVTVIINSLAVNLYLESGTQIEITLPTPGDRWITSTNSLLVISGENSSSTQNSYIQLSAVDTYFYRTNGNGKHQLLLNNLVIDCSIAGLYPAIGPSKGESLVEIRDCSILSESECYSSSTPVASILRIYNSKLISQGFNSYIVENAVAYPHSMEIYDSILGAASTPKNGVIGISDSSEYLFISNCVFWTPDASCPVINAPSGFPIHIGSRCVTTADLPVTQCINPLNGDLDCLLIFNQPFD
jgi:hypothetical protein